MSQKMIVTNLRMPQSDYLQIKSIAGELGMSVNEYMSRCARDITRQRMMKNTSKQNKHQETILEAFDRIAKMSNKPMGLSKEDEDIYFL
jgi:hypothetical protein